MDDQAANAALGESDATGPAGELDPAVVGTLVSAARKRAGLSMSELARRSGVSQPFISQVESGQFSPSLATLYRLAGVLAVPVSALLPSEDVAETGVVRSGHGTPVPIVEDRPNAVGLLVSRGGASQLEAYTYELAPGSTDESPFAHPGEEFAHIQSGCLVVEIEPDPPLELRAGDSIHFDASRPHIWTVPGPDPVRFLLVMSHPIAGHESAPET